YASSSELQRYFRVTRWLQRVPFRSEFKEEYLAYYLLGVMYPARNKAAEAASRWMGLRSDFFGKLFGTGTHWELARCNEWQSTEHPVTIDHHFFKSKAEILVVRAESIGGEATLWPEDRERAEGAPRSKAVEFRVFSPFTRPENAAFEALRHLPGQEQSGGLQLSAWLGIDSARQLVGPHVLSVLDRHGPSAKKILGDDFPESALWWRQGNWVEVTMKLRGVWHGLTELDARAPNFMRSPLWHKKTLNAVAASWVQDCHAWTVPLKPSAITPLAVGRARGLVEPVPEFYLRMSWIAKWMAQEIAEVEVYRNPVPARIRDTQRLAESLRAKVKLNPTEEQIEDLLWTAAGVLAKIDFSHGVKLGGPPTIIGVLAAADELDALAHDLALEAKPGGRLWRQVLLTTVRLEPLWKELEVLCLRLSMIAGKQLAGETLTLEESNVVLFFGLTLSRIMLYEDAAPSFPVDDSPKIVRPAAGPSRGTAFHAATGRPRILYVLYPWQGSELFCQGVILPYHEVESDRPMDDQEWRKLWPRTAGSRPQAAKWLEGFIPAEGARVTERGNE
ncbi:MAG TPA: DUF3160 domain-containing protein, partial [Verrucomicrobium sp.]|nr:DUF3160 domain-containing protein [Verrucomicrobium sp.]